MTATIPPGTPPEIAEIIEKLFGDEDIGGFWVSDDLSKVQARVFVDGSMSVQTYEKDEGTGEYKLTSYVPIGRAKL